MCGITGYISKNISKQELEKSVQTLKHRGPNNQNTWIKNNIGLGHTRLSIIDLSNDANQPMFSHNGRFVMVYNGEVYNYRQLAEKYHIETKTSSDSEVVLELFDKQNNKFIDELNGMFTIVIYDKQEKKLFLFRDRMGIKPLFYYSDGENFAFASEIKALLRYRIVKEHLRINYSVIADFLHLGYVPELHTFFENIYKFPAGSYGIFKNNHLQIKPYWELEKQITPATFNDFNQAKTKLNELLIESVKTRMISDVPLGTFLSGGVDSSLVTAIAQKISPQPVKTFSIGFKESEFNEAVYAKKVANYLKTDHHEFIVSQNDILELIDGFFHAYDEPFADSSGFPTMLISKLAKQYVTVALSGDGGDELFHGYGAYIWAKRLNNPLFKTFRKPIASVLSTQSDRSKRAAGLFMYKNTQTLKSHIFSQEQYLFSINEINSLLVDRVVFAGDENIICSRKLTKTEEQSIFDIKNYLKDDLLIKVDRASMAYGLEVRVPLLDHNIIEFALNIHHSLKIKNGEQKYLLKQVLYDYLPKELFDRPKWGFAIPLEKWLRTDLKYLLDKYTSKEIIEQFGIVNFDEVEKLKVKYLSGVDYLHNRLWLIIVLHKNLENYGFAIRNSKKK